MLFGYTDKAVFESGGGGLLSTVTDYMRFAKMLLNDGALEGTRILSPNSVHMMRQDHIGDTKAQARLTSIMPRDGIGFGLGFGTITDQGLSGLALPKGSYFWGGAAGTFFWIDPENELIGLFMTQVVPHRTTLRQDMWGLTYQAINDKRLND
jgi:CubicO group peptidase (beta-lactamase class C family)